MNVVKDAGPIATIDQFKAALLATRDWEGISPTQLRMLQAQCRAPECTISPTQMAEQLELKNFVAARQKYAAFARSIAERLGYMPPQQGKGARCWWFTLSTTGGLAGDASSDQVRWTMRPELVAALRGMKWV